MRISEMRQTSTERFTLVFDDGSAMKTTLDIVAGMYLYSGMELDEADFEALKNASEYSLCQGHAARLISQQAMSKKGLRDKLVQKGETPENAQKAADRLEELGVLDDSVFAGIVVRHYAAKGFGAGRIKNELYRHGVPRELWDEGLKEMPVQDEKMDRFIRTRLTDPEDRAQIKKVADGLARRGYSWSEIKEALARFKAEAEETQWTEQ